jgi:hypothetical protein
LRAIERPVPDASRNGSNLGLSWKDAYWTPATGREFGTYGIFGNLFGTDRFDMGGGDYRISPHSFGQFKKERLRAAIDATKSAFYHYAQLSKKVKGR